MIPKWKRRFQIELQFEISFFSTTTQLKLDWQVQNYQSDLTPIKGVMRQSGLIQGTKNCQLLEMGTGAQSKAAKKPKKPDLVKTILMFKF